ncbi:hypothetical protein [Aeromonas dhakensis]|uniref:hypothetical protein n=1 Tax=Aeromonas dhakensis TaxID=196024 RepID=UPI002B463C7B|nr:hypothetical protein [Aeromonas dhakensis]
MKFINIKSDNLPDINITIKECVNLGQWLLFKSNVRLIDSDEVSFYLKVEQSYFCLNEYGKVICQLDHVNSEFVMDEVFYFSDLPKPSSLSNSVNFKM